MEIMAKKSTPKASAKPRAAEVVPPKKKKRRKIVIKKKPRNSSIIDIDQVLIKVNFVQTKREQVSFWVTTEDSYTVDNILKDAGVLFEKDSEEKPCQVLYEVNPGPQEVEGSNALEDLDEIDDEILEDGQIFD